MEIKMDSYIIRNDPAAAGFFILYREVMISDTKSKNFGTMREEVLAYAVRLSRVMDIISADNINKLNYSDIRSYVNAKEEEIRNLLLVFDKKIKAL